jgi:hypothetical protein
MGKDREIGGFAERALIHENQLVAVPKKLPFAQAALHGCGVVTGAGSVLNTTNDKWDKPRRQISLERNRGAPTISGLDLETTIFSVSGRGRFVFLTSLFIELIEDCVKWRRRGIPFIGTNDEWGNRRLAR